MGSSNRFLPSYHVTATVVLVRRNISSITMPVKYVLCQGARASTAAHADSGVPIYPEISENDRLRMEVAAGEPGVRWVRRAEYRLSVSCHRHVEIDAIPRGDPHKVPPRLSCQGSDDRVYVRATNQLLPCIAWIVLEGDDTSRLEFYHLLFDDLATIPCGLHNFTYSLALRQHVIWHLSAPFDLPSGRRRDPFTSM
jgi:hypothetical protein